MSHAERCPICFGKGNIFTPNCYSTDGGTTETCHGCGGTGWITVQDEAARAIKDKLESIFSTDDPPEASPEDRTARPQIIRDIAAGLVFGDKKEKP